MKIIRHYSWSLKYFLIASFLQLLFLIPINSQQTAIGSSWLSFNTVYGYDSLYSYTMNLVKEDKFNLYATYKLPKILVGKDNYRIRPIILDWSQYYFAKYNKRKLSYSELLKVVPYIDTTNLIKDEIKNFLAVLIYITPGEKNFVFDKNKDFDFSNDSIYSFSLQHINNQSTENWEQYSIIINDTFDFVVNKKIQKLQIDFFVFPFKSPNLKIAEIDDYFFEYSEPIKLYKTSGPDNMKLYLEKNYLDTMKYVHIKIRNEDGRMRSKNYKPGGKFSYLKNSYLIDSLNNNNYVKILRLSTEDTTLAIGREKNLYFSNHIFGFSQYGKPLATNKYGEKYLLIDFWATWCNPCIKSIPKLKEIYKKFNNSKFQIVSISIDNPAQTEKVEKFIKSHGLVWDVMLPNSGIYPKELQSIPKFFLLDPGGKIITVANGLFELPMIQKKLEDLFGN